MPLMSKLGMKPKEIRVRQDFWPKIRRVLGRIPFAEGLLAAHYCAMDSETPAHVKAILLGALVYFIVPVDLVPDFIALLGFTDDAAVLFMAVNRVRRHIRPEHREKARAYLGSV